MKVMSEKKYYFFLGTEAELIKMTPVLKIFNNKKIPYKIISSGQNIITDSAMLKYLDRKVDIYLSKKPVYQNPFGLILWLTTSLFLGVKILRKEFRSQNRNKVWFIIHGDTVSSALGAIFGRLFNIKTAHVEAGYKSKNLFHPFPEEIDRRFASFLSDVLFCPYKSIGIKSKTNTKSVDIGYNTSIDSLHLALNKSVKTDLLTRLKGKKYFIFALHRQETLINEKLFIKLIRMLIGLKTNLHCVFALHHPTKKLLEDLNLMKELTGKPNIIVTPRLSYFEYIHVLNRSEFIMTDGVGNQQETYYLGKPCLILRYLTEGLEGLNHNAILSKNNMSTIKKFIKEYKKYKKPPIMFKRSPSRVITNYLLTEARNDV